MDALPPVLSPLPDFEIGIGYVEAVRLAGCGLLEIELVPDRKHEGSGDGWRLIGRDRRGKQGKGGEERSEYEGGVEPEGSETGDRAGGPHALFAAIRRSSLRQTEAEGPVEHPSRLREAETIAGSAEQDRGHFRA